MSTKNLLFTFLLFLSSINLFAGTPSGGLITYKYLGNDKYEITAKWYRDCRGIPQSSYGLTMRCASTGTTKSLTPTVISYTDITPLCKTAGKFCNPSNTTVSVSGPAYEEHKLMDTIDFAGSESSFKSCCKIQFGMGLCCRAGGITTGAAGNDFWVYSTLDLCNASGNSSPEFIYNPHLIGISNQITKWDFGAVDSKDGDSLSYSLINPKTSWTGLTTWTGSFNAKEPFSVYYPSGYDKSNGPNPNAPTPIGIYLDPVSGMLTFVPVNNTETSVLAVSVKEWRKDSKGKYIEIGEVVLDNSVIIQSGPNNFIPTIQGSHNISICEGELFQQTFATFDKPVKLSSGTINNDTVMINKWVTDIKGASIKKDSTTTKQEALVFSWTPSKSNIRTAPYILKIAISDNNCPYVGESVEEFKITVYPKVIFNASKKKLSESDYEVSVKITNPLSNSFFTSSVKTNQPYDTRSFYYKSNHKLNSDLLTDTLVFRKNGTYILNRNYISPVPCNNITTSDTIIITGLSEVKLSKSTDTILCKNAISGLTAITTNVKRPVTYTWKSKGFTSTDTLGYLNKVFTGTDTVLVSIVDALGRRNSTYVNISVTNLPKISGGNDVTTCPGDDAVIIGSNLGSDTLSWRWELNGQISSMDDTLRTSNNGNYALIGTNRFGCIAIDSVKVFNYKPLKVGLISGTYCQNQNVLKQVDLFGNNPNPNRFTNLQWNLYKTLKKLSGASNNWYDLLVDTDPGFKLNYNFYIDKNRVYITGTYKDSLILEVIATDSNGCKSKASSTIRIIVMPEIDLNFKTFSFCSDDSLNLNNTVATDGDVKWMAEDKSTFENWPVKGEIKNGKLNYSNFKPSGGVYFVKLLSSHEKCISKDSLSVTVLQVPKPQIETITYYDSIRFNDKSLYSNGRKWYFNNIYQGNGPSLKLRKLEANNATIRLDLNNGDCFSDTSFSINTASIAAINNSKISVYPNPVNSILSIDGLPQNAKTQFQILDFQGRIVSTGNFTGNLGVVNVEALSSGLYQVVLNVNGQIVSRKFSKLSE